MISVVIPLYNKELSIKQTLDSLSAQQGEFEVVIVDDGSTDQSYSIAKEYAAKDSRILLLKQPNGGPSKARNTGVRQAKGEWILFLDADDELLPEALSAFEKAIAQQPNAQFILGSYYLETKGQKTLCHITKREVVNNPFKALLIGNLNIRIGSFVCTKALCLKQPFNEKLRRYEDFECIFRMFRENGVFAIDTPVLINHNDYAQASNARKDVKEDFVGHLNFHGKSFWERICLYQLFVWERNYYPNRCRELYPQLYRRYDLLAFYKLLSWMRNIKREHLS